MTIDQLKEILLKPAMQMSNLELAKKLLYDGPPAVKSTRVRQDRSVPNKLESEWGQKLKSDFPGECFRFGERRYKLANGVWYKPDWTCSNHLPVGSILDANETAWEVKGPHAWRGGLEFLKIAAHEWPEVRWILVWKENGVWHDQIVVS